MEFSAYDGHGRRKYLNAGENERFLNAVRAMLPADQVFCRTLYYTGCRLSETLSLGPASIDHEAKVIAIRTLKKREKEQIRRIPVPEELLSNFEELNCTSEKFWEFSLTTAWRIVKTVMFLSETEGIHACPKGLRHGFGVRCALAGIPITTIQEWMGHSNVETTAIYLNVRDAEERELMRKTWGNVR